MGRAEIQRYTAPDGSWHIVYRLGDPTNRVVEYHQHPPRTEKRHDDLADLPWASKPPDALFCLVRVGVFGDPAYHYGLAMRDAKGEREVGLMDGSGGGLTDDDWPVGAVFEFCEVQAKP